MQGELFKKNRWQVHTCHKCGSLGTIVEKGLCCELKAWLAAQNSRGAKLESTPRLSSHDSDTTRNEGEAIK